MPRIEPFRALRYDPERVELSNVIAPPYDVVAREERGQLYDRDPHNAVRYAVHVGGPNSTIASMTGALVGARFGARGLPTTWRARLDGAEKIEELADRLSQQHTAALTAS